LLCRSFLVWCSSTCLFLVLLTHTHTHDIMCLCVCIPHQCQGFFLFSFFPFFNFFSPVFYSRSFELSDLILKSLICFKLSFVSGVK
jgi:hypothetical protein